ncbi:MULTISPECIES: aminopeptidase P family protein [unclassified Proteiniphilum]|uniref:aminopeptidase P family protein n=1 Tax=unclassified Proteiniphilum TaxID=2622718 RepID=UPI000E9BBECB|nr:MULTISPECIES: aminopeptidase P family protein [unclassified Proteiniphilum]HBG56474.1 Xaa-Pro aminopeptidase [Porphyromonadaceae bacterium]
MFSKEIYTERRKKLKETFQTGSLLFLGNGECGINYADNTYYFRQDSTFLYFFGISKPDLIAWIDIDADKDYIFGDDPTIDSIVWTGSQPTISEVAQQAGIQFTGSLSDFKKMITRANPHHVRYLPPYRGEHLLKLSAYMGCTPNEVTEKSSREFIIAVARQRNIKSDEEIAEIEKAVNVTVDMHLAAMHHARAGMIEAEVTARVHEVAIAAGGNLSFPIIGTINGQFLHNHYHGNRLREGNLFLLDAGYETPMGYAGDMSSTFPVSEKFTSRQKEIYQITLEAHNKAIELSLPGANFKDVHLKVGEIIFDGLKTLGLTKGDTKEAVSNGAHALFFPCGTGHLMGLDVHDMENLGEQIVGYDDAPKSTQFGLKSLRLGRVLNPGFVLTIEPGIYFIPELIDHWESNKINSDFINFNEVNRYRDFGGIRNEENILITEAGNRILGKPLAKSIEDVEQERLKAFQ